MRGLEDVVLSVKHFKFTEKDGESFKGMVEQWGRLRKVFFKFGEIEYGLE